MIIKKLIIYGYGKWIDTEFDVNAPFHLFFGENEAGKSTLMSFIHSMFFGFPTRHSSAKRYEPKESSRYGGKIIIKDKRFGEVSIERVSGKVTGDVVVQLEDGTTGDESLLTTLFYSKTRSFYESIYSFDLKGIENIQDLSKEQLNRFFLSIGALGHENFLKQADYYHTQAGKLFKPMGRKPEINQLQLKLKDKQREVEKAKEKNESYIDLITSHLSKQEQMKEIEKKLAITVEELNYQNELSKYKETLEEIERIREQLKKLPDQKLPEDGLYQLKQTNSEVETYQQKINELQDKQKTLQHQYKPSRELILYQQNEETLNGFEQELDHWEDKVQELQLKKKDLSNLEQLITEMKIREDISLADEIPPALEQSDIGYLNSTRNRIEKLEKKRGELEDNHRNLMSRININNDMMDKIEPKLMSLSEFNALEAMDADSTLKGEEKKPKLLLTAAVSAAFLLSAYLLTVDALFALVTAVLFLIVFYIGYRIKKPSAEAYSDDQRDLLYQQRNLREQWKELLAMNDDYQSKQEETANQLDKIKTTQRLIEEDFRQWKLNHSFSVNVALSDVEDKQAVYHRLRELKKRESVLKQQTDDIEKRLKTQLDAFEEALTRKFLSESILEKFKEMRSIFREIKNEQRGMQEYIKQTEAVQHEINYYVQKLNELKKTKRQFTDSLQCANDEEVYKLYSEQKEKQEKETRLSMLSEKLPVKEGDDTVGLKLNHVKKNLDELKKRHQKLSEEQKVCMKAIMADEMKIRRLEDGGVYTELLQEFENEKSYYQEVVNKWTTLKTAAGIIEKTLHYAKEDKLPQALSIAGSFFSFLTDGRYQSLLFEDDVLFVIDKFGRRWRSDDLSRGTVEPLYISLRLAFIKATKESIKLPVLIDDPFVNLDDKRVRKMYQLLNDFDPDIQMIYFSFDPRIQAFIEEDKCVYLNK
ncbi:Uncharacterized protein YhaN [Alkalibacterium subtropicum]|uniref:Uncharacterized protein YhaN n=1 Tax=Alkalibacterium subtropicum TaxID=753702 RepID=A0A1I1E866_9LACT|nr:AAA family ATPase [Alkalibacterium subtropicum]SFB83359.1 Uncharacterized protein YhaN [Alkalibacterium subtropicum]